LAGYNRLKTRSILKSLYLCNKNITFHRYFSEYWDNTEEHSCKGVSE
jgi:hypothetical protein